MSLADIASLAGKIAGMPGMDLAVSAAIDLIQTAQNVKVYRAQCQNLGSRCTNLLVSYHEKCKGLEGTDLMESVDDITEIVRRCQKKAEEWASMNWPKSFLHQGDIKQNLYILNKKIDDCGQKFNIASGADLRRGNMELHAMHERDAAEQREMLQKVLKAVDDLKETLANEPAAAQPLMQAIQEELQHGSADLDEQRDLQQGMYNIHRQTAILPPLINLTGQVEKTSEVVVYGAYNDVYQGLWLAEEEVALKFARAINHTPSARKRFQKEVEIWRDLQHRHVDRLFGIAYFDNHIYTVSPWMKNGSALQYINSTEEVIDRLTIIGDIASGMEYLHARLVVHGDLRAANVLIGDDGRACVSDFGLSRIIEEEVPEESSSSAHHGDRPVRWQAPELVDAEEIVPFSTRTDVWSYGMVCLEILTGKKPYSNRVRDAHVIRDLIAYRLPERPIDEMAVSRGLNDQMWQVMLACWNQEPRDRPKMADVKRVVRTLQAGVRPVLNGPLTSSPGNITKELPGTIGLAQDTSISPSPTSLFPPASSSLSTTGYAIIPLGHRHRASTSSGASSSLLGVPVTPELQARDTTMLAPTRSPKVAATGPSLKPMPRTNGSLDLIFDLEQPPTQTEASGRAQPPRIGRQQPSRDDSSKKQPSLLTRTRPSQYEEPSKSITQSSAERNNRLGLHLYSDSSSSEGYPRQQDEGISISPRSLPSLQTERRERDGSTSSGASYYQPTSNPLARSASQRSALTELDLPPAESILHASGRGGKVTSGNLEGLVERLVKKDLYARDQEFQEIFLTTYRLFSSTRDVLRLLIRLFNSNLESRSDRVERRFMALSIIQRLLKGHYAKAIEVSVLEDLKLFLQEVAEPLTAVASDIIKLTDDLISAGGDMSEASSVSPIFSSRRASRASEVIPRALAVALIILEGERYNSITPTDCVSELLSGKGSTNPTGSNQIDEARATHNKIVNWVKASIVKSSKKDKRADTLGFFIKTAIECRNLHNYSSTFALVAAIDSQTIGRLSQTKKALKKELLDAQRSLTTLFDISHNHRAYRTALPNPTEGRCLPWLAVHLRDLGGICEKYESRIVVGGETLINFEKFAAIYEGIRHMLAFQSGQGSSGRQSIERRLPELLYLEDKLAETQLGQAEEENMERRSLELHNLEEWELEELHRRLVESTGFQSP